MWQCQPKGMLSARAYVEGLNWEDDGEDIGYMRLEDMSAFFALPSLYIKGVLQNENRQH